jgi:hypothetical protein
MMMPATSDLKAHLANLRTLAEARVAYLAERVREDMMRPSGRDILRKAGR